MARAFVVVADGPGWFEVLGVFVGDACGLRAERLVQRLKDRDKEALERLPKHLRSRAFLELTVFKALIFSVE